MSVTRRGDRDKNATVQRRGEKNTVAPPTIAVEDRYTKKVEIKEDRYTNVELPRVAPPVPMQGSFKDPFAPRPVFYQQRSLSSESRIQERLKYLEENPAEKKKFEKQMQGLTTKAALALFAIFSFPVILMALGFLFVGYMVLYAAMPTVKAKGKESFAGLAETLTIATRLKKPSSKWNS